MVLHVFCVQMQWGGQSHDKSARLTEQRQVQPLESRPKPRYLFVPSKPIEYSTWGNSCSVNHCDTVLMKHEACHDKMSEDDWIAAKFYTRCALSDSRPEDCEKAIRANVGLVLLQYKIVRWQPHHLASPRTVCGRQQSESRVLGLRLQNQLLPSWY